MSVTVNCGPGSPRCNDDLGGGPQGAALNRFFESLKIYKPERFGANGTGDDTVAVQRTIDEAGTCGGGTVLLTQLYGISEPLNINYQSVLLTGHKPSMYGMANGLLVLGASSYNVVNIKANDFGMSNMTIRHIQAATAGYDLYAQAVLGTTLTGITLDNVQFFNPWSISYFERCQGIGIRNNVANQIWAPDYQFRFLSSNSVFIDGNNTSSWAQAPSGGQNPPSRTFSIEAATFRWNINANLIGIPSNVGVALFIDATSQTGIFSNNIIFQNVNVNANTIVNQSSQPGTILIHDNIPTLVNTAQ